MGALSTNDEARATLRVREVNRKSFKFQMQEWPEEDQAHGEEIVSYLIVEAGAHELPGGVWIEAGKSYSTGEFR
jgi:hypothetical protein